MNARVKAIALRLPSGWRLPALHLASAQPLSMLLGGAAVLVAVAIGSLGRNPQWTIGAFLLLALVLGLGLSTGTVASMTDGGRWEVLLQGPISATVHLARLVVLGLGLAGATVAGGVLLHLPWILAAEAARPVLLGGCAALLWLVELYAIGLGVSSLVRRFDWAATLLLLLLASYQLALLVVLDLEQHEWLRLLVEWVLPPVDALVEAASTLAGDASDWRARYAAQLTLHPLAWGGLAFVRVHRLERSGGR